MGEGPIYFFREYARKTFGRRVQKIPVALPFSCPNIDGSKGRGGCIYCFKGSRPAHLSPGVEIYDTALEFEGVVGIDVGTRPDCAPDEVLELLSSYRDLGFEVWIEFGLQSANFETLKRINRAHGVSDLVDAVLRSKRFGLKVCVHTIVGLPGEDREDFLETAKLIASLPVDGVKIHPIYVMRNTDLGRMFERGEFSPLSLEEYARRAADMLELIPPSVVVHRLTAEAEKPDLLAPDYCTYPRKLEVIGAVVSELERRGSAQGSRRAFFRSYSDIEGAGRNLDKLVERPG